MRQQVIKEGEDDTRIRTNPLEPEVAEASNAEPIVEVPKKQLSEEMLE